MPTPIDPSRPLAPARATDLASLTRARRWAAAAIEPTSPHADLDAVPAPELLRHIEQHDRIALRIAELHPSASSIPELRAAAQRQAQHTLLVRSVRDQVARTAHTAGVRALLLKWGPSPAGTTELAGGDVDIAVRATEVTALLPHLERDGWDATPHWRRARGWRTRFAGEPGLTLSHRAHPVTLDIHTGTPLLTPITMDDLFADAAPHRDAPFDVPSSVGRVWHFLCHSARKHPERWGLMRDLLRLRTAYLALDASERREIERRCAYAPASTALKALWEMAARPLPRVVTEEHVVATAALRAHYSATPVPALRAADRQMLAFSTMIGRGSVDTTIATRLFGSSSLAWGAPESPWHPAWRTARVGLLAAALAAIAPGAWWDAARVRRQVRASWRELNAGPSAASSTDGTP